MLECRAVRRVRRIETMFDFVGQALVAQHGVQFGLFNNRLDLGGAQQGHGGYSDKPRLDYCQPAGRHHGIIGATQQHTVTRNQAHVFCQHLGNLIGQVPELCVGKRLVFIAIGPTQGDTVAPPFVNMAVDQFCRTIQPRRIGDIRVALKQQLGPLIKWRQIFASKGIGVGRTFQGCLLNYFSAVRVR